MTISEKTDHMELLRLARFLLKMISVPVTRERFTLSRF